MGDGDGGGADMAVELEAGLNADRDPTSEFVTQGEKKGTGHVWTCKCCQGTFNGHKRKFNFSMTKIWVCGHAPLWL